MNPRALIGHWVSRSAFEIACGGVTTVPTQALTLMNSPFVRGLVKNLAARASTQAKSPAAALEQAFRLAFSRQPSAG